MESSESSTAVPLVVTLVFVSLGSLAWIYLHFRRFPAVKQSIGGGSEIDYPPTPPERHWLWKHARALRRDPRGYSHDVVFRNWMKKLDSKVVMFEVPILGRMISVGDAGLAQHVLTSPTGYPKSPTYRNNFPMIGTRSILTLEGSAWAHHRRLYNPGFAPAHLRGIVGVLARKCDRFLRACETHDIAREAPTDLLARAIRLTSDVIAQVAFGEDWGGRENGDNPHQGTRTLKTFRELTDMIAGLRKRPLHRLNPWYRRRLHQLSVAVDQDMQRLVKRRLASLQTTQRPREPSEENHAPAATNSTPDAKTVAQRDILSLTLSTVLRTNRDKQKAKNETDAEPSTCTDRSSEIVFSPEDMESTTSQLKTFYFAGHDTTATTIAWAFWLLLQNPQPLQRARDEVTNVMGRDWVEGLVGSTSTDDEEAILIPEKGTTYENLQKCQYLDAVARETLRLYPPATTARYAVDPDASFGGFKLGKSVIHINTYAIQRDPDLWGPDAETFRPERFLGDETRKKPMPGFLPFSRGARDCLGKYFALLETKLALAALVTRYDGTVVDPEQEVYAARLTNVPKNGCLVRLSRRKSTGRNDPAAS